MYGRSYVFRRQVTGLTADRALLQLQAPSDTSLVILRAWCSQETSETSLQTGIRLTRKSTAQTVTAAVIATDVFPLDPDDAASTVQVGTANTGYVGTTAGGTSSVLIQEGYNVVGSGWLYLPVPEERITVKAGAFLILEATETIATSLFNCGIVFLEL